MCRMDKELLYSYADNTIEPLEKIFVEEHLKYCSECKKELESIKNTDNMLENFDFEDIDIPDRLSALSELIAENCINEKEHENIQVQYKNYKEGMKQIRNTVIAGYKISQNNPYNNSIKNNINAGTGMIKKAVKNYYKNKLKKSRFNEKYLSKILKVV